MKIKPSKCSLFQSKVKYLGHIVSKDGVRPCKDNTKAILEYPQPRTVRQVKRFIGMVNFFRKFIKNASEIMQPLHGVANGKKLEWTENCSQAFELLKLKLTEPPILGYPDFSKLANEFILTTDASNVAAGATLTQMQNNVEVVLAYASTTFSVIERQYCATERELPPFAGL